MSSLRSGNPNIAVDLLALSAIPRWTIVPRAAEQSVADHTFRVMAIVVELCRMLKMECSNTLLINALTHDATECWTGDIPGPVKRELGWGNIDAARLCPWLSQLPAMTDTEATILKAADLIEAFTWIERWKVGERGMRAMESVRKQLARLIYEHPEISKEIVELRDAITYDDGR